MKEYEIEVELVLEVRRRVTIKVPAAASVGIAKEFAIDQAKHSYKAKALDILPGESLKLTRVRIPA